MSVASQLGYEASGIAVLIVVGVASVAITAVLSPLFPWINGAWVFVALVAIVLGWAIRTESPGDGTGDGDDGDGTEGDGADGDAVDEGGVLDVDLVNWANGLVGTTCLRCEEEITYIPMGVTDGRSEHRIECGCTLIESTAKE